ncbi:MAG: DUF4007 family protein [Polyangiaceae bacterium]
MQLERGSFAGHETFPFRYTWLRKAVLLTAEDSGLFRQDDAMVRLGVGKNMVRSIRHWGLATKIIHEDPAVHDNRGRALVPTELGRNLFGPEGWDEYLEDPATLWLLHWQLASTPTPSTTWFWTFNHAPQLQFLKTELITWMGRLVEQQGWSRVANSSLKRDIDCFIRTYVPVRPTRSVPLEDTLDCPLVELGLMREQGKHNYQVMRGHQPSLPDHIFAYALVSYLMNLEVQTKTVPLDDVAFKPGSPGRVFCLSEPALLERVERLDAVTDGTLVYDETAGLRQLFVRELPDPMSLLADYFEEQAAEGRAA